LAAVVVFAKHRIHGEGIQHRIAIGGDFADGPSDSLQIFRRRFAATIAQHGVPECLIRIASFLIPSVHQEASPNLSRFVQWISVARILCNDL
jgi:hypothetical protein